MCEPIKCAAAAYREMVQGNEGNFRLCHLSIVSVSIIHNFISYFSMYSRIPVLRCIPSSTLSCLVSSFLPCCPVRARLKFSSESATPERKTSDSIFVKFPYCRYNISLLNVVKKGNNNSKNPRITITMIVVNCRAQNGPDTHFFFVHKHRGEWNVESKAHEMDMDRWRDRARQRANAIHYYQCGWIFETAMYLHEIQHRKLPLRFYKTKSHFECNTKNNLEK